LLQGNVVINVEPPRHGQANIKPSFRPLCLPFNLLSNLLANLPSNLPSNILASFGPDSDVQQDRLVVQQDLFEVQQEAAACPDSHSDSRSDFDSRTA
jgi:hypothetical protein